nr:aldose 1-epimerase [Patulibacter sp. SYSU D01012]
MRRGALAAVVRGGPVLEVTSLTHDGAELLVPGHELPAPFAVHGDHGGIAFLHPWANRLGADAYALAGRRAALPPDAPGVTRDDGGRPIHGLRAPGPGWAVDADGPAGARARLEHPGEDGSPFPFPHAVEVAVTLTDSGLEATARVAATTDVPVPVAVGWHPYLRLPGAARRDWRLGAPPRRHLLAGPDGLPDGHERDEGAEDAPLAARAFDDGYRVDPPAPWTLSDGHRTLRVRPLAGFPVVQLFAPTSADVVSIEPMAAPVDALRHGTGIGWARPGAPFAVAFALDVEARGAPGYRCCG